MKELLKPTTDERPVMIISGIISFYILIAGFIIYLYILNRLSLIPTAILLLLVTIIYIPRFLIINKLQNKDKIEVLDTCIVINGNAISFSSISDFKIEDKKPQVVFFLNNKMVVFKEAVFHLRLQNGQTSFNVIGTEKIKLLKEFLTEITGREDAEKSKI